MSNFSNFFFFFCFCSQNRRGPRKTYGKKNGPRVEKVGHDRFCDPLGVVLFFFFYRSMSDHVALFPGNEAISHVMPARVVDPYRPAVAYRFVRTRAVMSRCRAVCDKRHAADKGHRATADRFFQRPRRRRGWSRRRRRRPRSSKSAAVGRVKVSPKNPVYIIRSVREKSSVIERHTENDDRHCRGVTPLRYRRLINTANSSRPLSF